MVGKLTSLVSATLLLAGGFSPAGAQAPADPQAPPAPPPMRRPGGFGGGERHRPNATPEEMEKFKNVRKALDELTPEQRQRFQENFLRWSNLSRSLIATLFAARKSTKTLMLRSRKPDSNLMPSDGNFSPDATARSGSGSRSRFAEKWTRKGDRC